MKSQSDGLKIDSMTTFVHNLNPFAIQFTETIGVRWYGLAYLSGFIVGYYSLLYMARKKTILLNEQQIADFVFYSAIGVLAGGRLGYCLFYAPELFLEFNSEALWWAPLQVWHGGMASHGGMLGVMVSSWVFGRVHKIPFWHLQDLTTFGGAIGFFFGRIANFINGELYGREAPPGLTWAVKFPQEMLVWGNADLEKTRALGPAVAALKEIPSNRGMMEVSVETWNQWVTAYSTSGGASELIRQAKESLIHAVQNGRTDVATLLEPVLTARYPSQLIQSVLEGLLVVIVLAIVWMKPRKPGVISCVFGACYALARIAGEQFRMPDVGIGFQALGLTRGQWLSIGLFLASIAVLIWASKRPTKPLGGWGLTGSVDLKK